MNYRPKTNAAISWDVSQKGGHEQEDRTGTETKNLKEVDVLTIQE
jgi:hypothetical protein